MNIKTIWPAELDLGEGPMWHAPSGRFFFVDIHGCAVHAWHPVSGQRQSWNMPERIGWLIARRDGDGFMAGFQSGFARLWLEPVLRIERLGSPHAGQPDVRLNDAKADCHGRIWAGSMNNVDTSRADGQLTRLDPDGHFTVVERGIHIANGPCISEDGRRMLHTDSALDCVYEYRVSPMGELMDKKEWKRFGGKQGTPDGMTLDADGNVWIAFWGGACLRQFTPDGDLLQRIDLPALNITCMAFGGEDMQSLVVTSARNGLSAKQLTQYPASGCVFLLRPGVAGVLPKTFG
ncbi:SMP-30/gluconolaconase/LRE-like protein [Rhodoferax lacus]|uniref:SMP-30/gluconolaconase/LRE-like protein n=1 Tax=Rhodoferax lacus TaxID=2184758 RepID=A0A3E1RCV7_9BURK|nr:SMP-30/gluconolactonase/LRE family protein [Rhodoferax lacus]RFO97198.1 SMP-30/gluconolaconase/LRE-like protein [Rhodoferax lacus]